MSDLIQEIYLYINPEGKSPFSQWLKSLRDLQAKRRIRARLDRVGQGNFGDFRAVGEGVYELRIAAGPGYRIYFGRVSNRIVLLLCGGDKSSQDRDIQQAKLYWRDYCANDDSNITKL